MTQEKFEKTLSLLKGVLDYESFKDVDMVIEVVINNVNLLCHYFVFMSFSSLKTFIYLVLQTGCY